MLIMQSKHIVARCGYSTVMDLATLMQKAVLVPTPGQTEQEYIAAHLQENRFFVTRKQENFSLAEAVSALQDTTADQTGINPRLQEDIIKNWVAGLMQR